MTVGDGVGKRHVSAESFDRYLGSRVPVVFPVPGTPEVFVFIEPLKPELGVRVEVEAYVEAPETGLRNIASRIELRDGRRFLEVVITVPALFRDAYPILCAMADRVQVAGLPATRALQATLDTMATLLDAPESMSREREVGLFGELLVLGGFIYDLGVDEALEAWRGPQAEEHDFGLPALDIEVKTTASERRVHWIESLTQLVPTGNRPLWLLSHQLTVAGTGHGATLPELIDIIRAKVDFEDARNKVERALSRSGWTEDERDRLNTRWVRRAESVAFRVAGDFPRLTPDVLRRGGLELERIPEVRYRINLDGLVVNQAPPAVLAKAIGFEG